LVVVALAGLGWPWWGRCIAAAILAGLWRCGRDWLAYPGAGVRRLIWDQQGGWWLQDPGRGLRALRLVAMPHTLGPWLWLHLRGPSGSNLTMIDARYAEPVGLCRLKAALKVEIRRLELEVRNA
jgi:hypothetical protein